MNWQDHSMGGIWRWKRPTQPTTLPPINQPYTLPPSAHKCTTVHAPKHNTHIHTSVFITHKKLYAVRMYTNILPVPSPCLPDTSIPNHCSYPGVSGVKGKGELTPPHVYTEDAYTVKICSTQVSSPHNV